MAFLTEDDLLSHVDNHVDDNPESASNSRLNEGANTHDKWFRASTPQEATPVDQNDLQFEAVMLAPALKTESDDINKIPARIQTTPSITQILSRYAISHPTIHDLPDEVIQLILAAYPETLKSFQDVNTESAQLCCVCKRWKAIAYATPALWTKFEFRIDMDDRSARHTPLSQLARSVAAPLDVSILIQGLLQSPDDTVPSTILETAQLLKSHSGRWDSLSLQRCVYNNQGQIYIRTPVSLIRTLLPASLPELREARLEDVHASPPLSLYCSAPRLRRLWCPNGSDNIFAETQNVIYAMFTILPYGPTLQESYPNITRLLISKWCNYSPGGIGSSRPQTLDRLETLVVSDYTPERVVDVIKVFYAPQLHTIEISHLPEASSPSARSRPFAFPGLRSKQEVKLPNLSLIRFGIDCKLLGVRYVFSQLETSKDVVMELSGRLRLLENTAPKTHFLKLGQDCRWLEKNSKDVRWLPPPEYESWSGYFHTWEEANAAS